MSEKGKTPAENGKRFGEEMRRRRREEFEMLIQLSSVVLDGALQLLREENRHREEMLAGKLDFLVKSDAKLDSSQVVINLEL